MAQILVVEDQSSLRNVLALALVSAGHEAIVAENGREGLQKFREHTPDLVLLDIFMPQMDGLEVLEQLRSKVPVPKVIVMSGAPLSWMVLNMAEKLGANEILSKPFRLTELMAAIAAVLSGGKELVSE